MAGWGFSLVVAQQYEDEALQNSAQLKSAQASVDSAQVRLDSASQYASIDIAALTARKEGLENALTTLERTLDGCPANYFTKCINPTKAKIASVKSELDPLLIKINGYQSYQSALTHKETMTKQLANLDASSINANEYIHPLFIAVAQMFGLTSIEAKNRLQFITFFLVEIIGGMCFLMVSLFGRTNEREFVFTESELKRVYGFVENDTTLISAIGEDDGRDGHMLTNKANEHTPKQNNPDKKAVGGVYQCQSCGEDYTAKTVWQKYCPVCSQLNRKRVLKTKSAQPAQ